MKKTSIVLSILLICSNSFIFRVDSEYEQYKFPQNIELYDMLIITPDQFSHTLQSFIHHKNSVGILTYQKTLESIYEEFQGRDKQEKIKFYIKHAIEEFEIKYVLLIGNINILPIRKTEVNWITFGKLTKKGHPRHPLYLSKNSKKYNFNMESYINSLI